MEPKIALVTAPKSKTGRRVVELLQHANILVRIGSRSTRIEFNWDDITTWEQAVTGIDCAYIIIPPNLAFSNMHLRLKQFLTLCEQNDMKRIVLLSGRGEAEALKCEEVLLTSKIPTTIVRASWFSQNFSEGFFLDSVLNGNIVVPVNGVKEPFIDANDIAEVIYQSLLDDSQENNIYELTGPELLTFENIAHLFNEKLNLDINVTHVPLESYLNELSEHGLSSQEITLTRYLFEELLDGRNAYLTTEVRDILGREATSFQQYIENTKPSGVWGSLSLKETTNDYQ